MRRRINISLNEREYEVIELFLRLYGFKTMCEVTVSLLNIASAFIQSLEQAGIDTTNIFKDTDILGLMKDWYGSPECFNALTRFRSTKETDGQYIDAYDIIEQQQMDTDENN